MASFRGPRFCSGVFSSGPFRAAGTMRVAKRLGQLHRVGDITSVAPLRSRQGRKSRLHDGPPAGLFRGSPWARSASRNRGTRGGGAPRAPPAAVSPPRHSARGSAPRRMGEAHGASSFRLRAVKGSFSVTRQFQRGSRTFSQCGSSFGNSVWKDWEDHTHISPCETARARPRPYALRSARGRHVCRRITLSIPPMSMRDRRLAPTPLGPHQPQRCPPAQSYRGCSAGYPPARLLPSSVQAGDVRGATGRDRSWGASVLPLVSCDMGRVSLRLQHRARRHGGAAETVG